jgi:hypothetical protein
MWDSGLRNSKLAIVDSSDGQIVGTYPMPLWVVYYCILRCGRIIRVFYLQTNAQENCSKRNIKIYIKTVPTCFGLITIIRDCIIRACESYCC